MISLAASELGSSPSGMIFAAGIGVAGVLIYLFIHHWHMWHRPPCLKTLPVFGISIELVKNYHRMHDWLLERFEQKSTFLAPMPGFRYAYTVDPENVEHILKINFQNYPKGEQFHEVMEVLLGDGIFNSDGELWRRQRKTASFEFASKVLRDFSTVVFRDYALKLSSIIQRSIARETAFDMQDLFMRMTLDSICKLGFGVEIGTLSPSLPENPFAIAFDNANAIVTQRFVDPFWKIKRYFNISQEALLHRSAKIVDEFTYKVIRTRRAEIEAIKAMGQFDRMKPDILSRFIVLGEDPEVEINDKTLRDIVLNFVIAGRDTTAVTLSWFTYMMATHPEIADKVYEELCQFQKNESANRDKPNGPAELSFNESISEFSKLLTYDSLSKLVYLHAAITETLRLFPAVPEDIKGVIADDVLPDGTKLRGGDQINYVPWCMGRMTKLWGPDAKEYRPQRWLKDGVFQPVSPFKFTAFQAGPRICLGKDSAFLQMKMSAATLFRFFKFYLAPGYPPVRYRMMAILSMDNGLKLTAVKRADL